MGTLSPWVRLLLAFKAADVRWGTQARCCLLPALGCVLGVLWSEGRLLFAHEGLALGGRSRRRLPARHPSHPPPSH